MPQFQRRLLPAGVLLLVLALALTACAANGVAAPNASTSTTSSTGSDLAATTAAPTSESGAGAASTTEPPAATTGPLATTTGPATATASGSPLGTPEQGAGSATPAMGTATASSGSGTAMGADGITTATYTATEYSYSGPDQVTAGWTRLTLDNQGKASHDLMLYKIAAGKTLSDVTQSLQSDGPPDWAQAYGSVTVAPGSQASYVVDLEPGNYVLLSFGNNPQGPPDAAQGMLKMITVNGTAPAASSVQLPQPDVTIDMVDYRFEMTGTFKSGAQTIFLQNSGTEMHEAQVFHLNAGTTFEQFQQLLMSANGYEQPNIPATSVWGMTLSPGISAYATAELTTGDYAVVCFIPSPKNGGKPHYMLGMISSFSVK